MNNNLRIHSTYEFARSDRPPCIHCRVGQSAADGDGGRRAAVDYDIHDVDDDDDDGAIAACSAVAETAAARRRSERRRSADVRDDGDPSGDTARRISVHHDD